MRTPLLLALGGLSSIGCGSQPLLFEHVATLAHPTEGAAIRYTGTKVAAGMSSQVCDVEVLGEWAGVVADHDWTTGIETVEDAHGNAIAVRSEKGLHLIDQGSLGLADYFTAPGITHARLHDDGAVYLQQLGELCKAVWVVGDEERVAVSLDAAVCDLDSSVAVDRTTGELLVATVEGQLVSVSEDGAYAQGSIEGDLVALDGTNGTIYHGSLGASIVEGVEAGGNAWSAELEGSLFDLADMGDMGSVLVSSVSSDGSGRLDVFSGQGGGFIDGLAIPQVGEVITAGNGTLIGVVLDNEIEFLTVEEDGRNDFDLSPKADASVRYID